MTRPAARRTALVLALCGLLGCSQPVATTDGHSVPSSVTPSSAADSNPQAESLAEVERDPLPDATVSTVDVGVTATSSPLIAAEPDIPSWVESGRAAMRAASTTCGPTTEPEIVLTVVTATSAVHFAGCPTGAGRAPESVWAYMQPDPTVCGWGPYFQTPCDGVTVTLVWQLDDSRGFLPDQVGVLTTSDSAFEITGAAAGNRAVYRYFGEVHLGYSVLDIGE